MTTPHKEITSGLKFPEGPIAMPDGSVILVEIARETLTRVMPDGKQHVIAKLGGGPNGAAMGPNGKIYVCNNGGFNWIERPDGRLFPGTQPANYKGGSIQVVDPETGKFETMYDQCNGRKLNGPNDIVFDKDGGFWFTDLGKTREHDSDRGAVYYAKADGSKIEQKVFPLERPNGCGLSPDEKTLYVVETPTARCWAFELSAPGVIKDANGPYRGEKGRVIAGLGGYQMFDSMAVEANGNVCVATLVSGCISVIAPDGRLVEQVPTGDRVTTNIAFGGPELKTAYITLSGKGELIAMDWPRPGLPLNFLNK
jgi:gluconolactonase